MAVGCIADFLFVCCDWTRSSAKPRICGRAQTFLPTFVVQIAHSVVQIAHSDVRIAHSVVRIADSVVRIAYNVGMHALQVPSNARTQRGGRCFGGVHTWK